MSISHVSRRALMAGLSSLAVPSLASAAEESPVAHGFLKDNKLAQAFKPAPDHLPDVTVMSLTGDRSVADLLKGRTILMPIWAEWCVPCLTELPDFARLQSVYGRGKFAIVPVLSGAKKQMTPQVIAALFSLLNASVFEPLVERRFGDRLITTMGHKDRSYAIPCNVLIAPDGRVIGREIGLASNQPEGAADDTDKSDRYAVVNKAAHGEPQSLWGTPAGDEFAVVMANGFFG